MFLTKPTKNQLNNKGFSLVELMIVVAIIGLLAAIGVPQYQKFQSRARTSEAKAALGALYSSMQSFRAEWNCYTSDLRNIGFGVTGQGLRYVTGFNQTSANAGCAAGAPAANGANFGLSNGNNDAPTRTQISPGAGWALSAAIQTLTATEVDGRDALGANNFTGVSTGDPKNTMNAAAIGDLDSWTINNNKQVSNPQSRL